MTLTPTQLLDRLHFEMSTLNRLSADGRTVTMEIHPYKPADVGRIVTALLALQPDLVITIGPDTRAQKPVITVGPLPVGIPGTLPRARGAR